MRTDITKPPWSCSRARINFLRHSNTVFSLVRLIMWLLRTNKSTVLLWRKKCIRALEQLHEGFSVIGAHQNFENPDFFMPKLLLKELWRYLGKYSLLSEITTYRTVLPALFLDKTVVPGIHYCKFRHTLWSNQIGTVRYRTIFVSLQLMNNTLRQVQSKKQLLLYTNTDKCQFSNCSYLIALQCTITI